MARARSLKPSLFKNEVLGVADPLYTLLFEGLWTLADREGRLEDRPLRIRAEVFPYRDGVNIVQMLDWLQSNGFILRYEVDGKRYISVLEFARHQNPHKNEAPSEIPAPPENAVANQQVEAARCDAASTSEKIGSARADSLNLTPDSLNPVVSDEANASSSSPGGDGGTAEGFAIVGGRGASLPACPYDDIVDAYHAALPELPAVKLRDGKTWEARKRAMRERWRWVLTSNRSDGKRRAETVEQAMDWTRGFFDRVRDNDFLMGRSQRSGDHANWRCDFDFLLTERGLRQVIEKTR